MPDQEIPPAPPQDRRKRRYSMSLVNLARRMYGDGDSWTPTQIREYLERKHGADGLSLMTVRCWVVPGAAEEQRRRNAESYARRAGTRGHRGRLARDELLAWALLLNRQMALMAMFAVAAQDRPREEREPSSAELDQVMLELRSRRLAYPVIATVLELYHGASLTPEQVRYRLRALGVKPMEGKAEATRRHWIRRRAAA